MDIRMNRLFDKRPRLAAGGGGAGGGILGSTIVFTGQTGAMSCWPNDGALSGVRAGSSITWLTI
jgi:hypothetical protein